MIKLITLVFYLVLGITVVGQAAPASNDQSAKSDLSYDQSILAEYREPFDIAAYFRLLPNSLLRLDQNQRKAIIKMAGKTYKEGVVTSTVIVDRKNCFLSIDNEGDGGGDSWEVVYWILKDQSRLIGVNRTSWGMCCPESKLKLFTFKDQAG